ncbi:hypothetical protein DFQ30_002669 [Apophysomyces sp. BC1015]|nr:hypothetical protein DFQ30_002669 [Apophysomyces sp. BC1015]
MDPLNGYNYLLENNDLLNLGNPTNPYLLDPPVNQQHMTNMNEIRGDFPPDDIQQHHRHHHHRQQQQQQQHHHHHQQQQQQQQPPPLQHRRQRRRNDIEKDGILHVLSSVGKILYCSDSCAELTGYHAHELLGQLLTDFVHVEDLDSFVHNLNLSFHTQSQITIHYRFRKKDDTYLLLESIGHPRSPENPGQPPSFFGIARPYSASTSINLLDSFLELKMENELLRKQLKEVTAERDETIMNLQQQQHQYAFDTIPGTNSSTSSQTSRRASSILFQPDDNTSSPWPDRRQSISTIDDSLLAMAYPSDENNNNNVQIETSDSSRPGFAPNEEGLNRKDKWKRRIVEQLRHQNGEKVHKVQKHLNAGMLEMIRQPVTPELLTHVTHQASLVIPCERLPEDQIKPTDLPSLSTFVSLLVKRSSVRAGTLLGVLVFLDRLQKQLSPIAKGMPCTCHRIFLATLIVTSKALHDSSPKNKHWVKYAVFFNLSEVGLMEIQLLSLMNYQLLIAPDDLYHAYAVFEASCLRSYPIQVSPSLAPVAPPTDLDDEDEQNEMIPCRPSLIRVHSEATSSSSLTSNPDSVATPSSLASPVSDKPEMFYPPEPPLFYPPAHLRHSLPEDTIRKTEPGLLHPPWQDPLLQHLASVPKALPANREKLLFLPTAL